MAFLDLFKLPDINEGVKKYKTVPGAVLLDVRSPAEYRSGRIPGSRNIPLQSIDNIDGMIENKDTPLYVYCHSGARSRMAAEQLQDMGYTNTTNIGGIAAYTGKVER